MDTDEQIKNLRDALAVTVERGIAPDNVVLAAIAAGFDTRKDLKVALGLGYPEIEKALERQSGEIRSVQVGQIERFRLVSASKNGHPGPEAKDSVAGGYPELEKVGYVAREKKSRRGRSPMISKADVEAAVSPVGDKEEPAPYSGTSDTWNAPLDDAEVFCEKNCPGEGYDHVADCKFSSASRAKTVIGPIPTGVRVGIDGNGAWLETEDGTRIRNVEVEKIDYSAGVLSTRITLKFLKGQSDGRTN